MRCLSQLMCLNKQAQHAQCCRRSTAEEAARLDDPVLTAPPPPVSVKGFPPLREPSMVIRWEHLLTQLAV